MIKLSKQNFILFLLLFPFFMPTYFEILPFGYLLYRLGMMFSVVYISLSYLISKKIPSSITWLIVVYEALVVSLTILQGGEIVTAIWSAEKIIGLVLLVDYYQENIISFLKVVLVHFEWLIYINFITILLFSERFFSRFTSAYGFTQEWFLGSVNNFIFWFFPALVVAWLYYFLSGEIFRTCSLTVVIALTELIRGSATGRIAVFLFILFVTSSWLRKIISPKLVFIGVTVLGIFIVFLQNVDFLEPIVVQLLGKKMTFSNRTYIWSNAVTVIRKNFVGLGLQSSDYVIRLLGNINGYLQPTVTHAHNEFLQVAFQTGILGFILYCWIYIKVLINAVKFSGPIAQTVMLFFAVYNVIAITETLELSQIYMLFPLIYFVMQYTAERK